MRDGFLTPTGALRALWSLVMTLLLAALIGIGCIVFTTVYTNHAQQQADRREREADRRWCALLTVLDQPGTPVTTERGRRIQQEVRELRGELGCGPSTTRIAPTEEP